MKKILPILLFVVCILTGIASADAPFQVSLAISDPAFETSVIVSTGNKIAIRLGDTDVTLEVQEKQAEGLNFKFDPALQFKDEQHGFADVSYLLLPANTTNNYTEVGKESPILTISWTELTLPEAYENILNVAKEVLNGNPAANENKTISVIFNMLAGTDFAANAGFYVTDLDGNGTPELLLGENQPMSDSTVFYDLYTIKDGELVHVFDGWDRNRYYLCTNGGFANEGSSSAFESSTAYYYYTDGELRLMQSLIYNSNANSENPWRLSTSSAHEVSDNDQLLSESEASYLKATYPYQKVELDSFDR
ncbi:MAG: hypothetical protein II969_04665 [Anaerolineaceae bacterium]|nr:hypothetical protein [Anaerolineaceae bacterium]